MNESLPDRRLTRRRLLGGLAVTGTALSASVAAGVGGGSSLQESPGAMRCSETYDRTAQDVECNAISAVDGGYYLAGSVGFPGGTRHGWVQRVDETGAPEWEFVDNRPGDEAPLYSVVTEPNGGCLAGGDVTTHLTDETNATALSLDSDGALNWGSEYARSWHVSANAATRVDDGYVLAGHARSYSTQGTKIILVSIDDEGEQRWLRTFGGSATVNICYDMVPVDGGYLLAGSTDREDDSQVLLARTDENGEIDWEELYDIEGAYSLAHGVVPTDDGGYLLGGRTGDSSHIFRAVVVKTDGDGVEQWRWVNDVESACHDLVVRPDGGCVLAGRRLDKGWLAAINADGDLIASESYSGEGRGSFGSLLSVDDGYITAGQTFEFDETQSQGWLVSAGRLAESGADPIDTEYSLAEQDDDSLPGFSAIGSVVGISTAYALSRRFGTTDDD